MAVDTELVDERVEEERVGVRLQNALQNLSEIVVHHSGATDSTKRRPSGNASNAGADWHEKMLQLENSISRIRSITSNYAGFNAGNEDHGDRASFGATIHAEAPAQFTAPKPTVLERELDYARQWNTMPAGPPPIDEDRPRSMQSGHGQNRDDPGCGRPQASTPKASRPLTPKASSRPATAENPRPTTPRNSAENPRPTTPRNSRPATPSSRPASALVPALQTPEAKATAVSRKCQSDPGPTRESSASRKNLHIEGSTNQKDLPSEGSSSQKDLQINGSRKDLHITESASRKDLQITGSASRKDLHMDGSASQKDLQVEGSKEEKKMLQETELREVSRVIGEKAALRFKSLRDCFFFADTQHNGQILVNGVQRLCRLFNVDDAMADHFFRLLDVDGRGFVDFREICVWLGPHIQPGYHPPKLSQHPAHQPRQPLGVGPSSRGGQITESDERRRELQRLSELVASKAIQKFKGRGFMNEIFRHIDTAGDGMISRPDIHRFFRSFNLETDVADRFFNLLDVESTGEIDYNDLRAHVGPHLAPGYTPPQQAKVEVPAASENETINASWDNFQKMSGIAAPQKRDRPQSARSHRDDQAKQAKIKALNEEREKTRAVNQMISTLKSKAFFRFKSVRDLFRFADENKDGQISQQELCRFIESFGLPRSTAEHYFKFLHKDKSGEVSFAEFMNFFGPIIKPGQQQYPLPSTPPEVPEQRKLSAEKRSQSAKQLQRPSSAASTASGSTKDSSSHCSKESIAVASSRSSSSSRRSSKPRSKSSHQSASRKEEVEEKPIKKESFWKRLGKAEEARTQEDLPMVPVDSRHRLQACNNVRGEACWFPQEYVAATFPRPKSPAVNPPYAENLEVDKTRRMRTSQTFNSSRVADRLRSPSVPVLEPHKPKAPAAPKPDRTPRFRMMTTTSKNEVRKEVKDAQGRLIREFGSRGPTIVAMRADLDAKGRPMTPRSLGRKLQEQEEESLRRSASASQPLPLTPRGGAVLGLSRPHTLDHQGNLCFDLGHGAVEPFRTVGEALRGNRGSDDPGADAVQTNEAAHHDGESSRGRKASRSPIRHFTNQLGQNCFDISGRDPHGSVAEALGRTW